jgi:hypothetical protein
VVATWEEMEGACRPALADLDRSRPGLLRLGPRPESLPAVDPWGNDGASLWLWDTGGQGTGVWLGEPEEAPSAALFRACEAVQEAAIEAVHGAWPECPDHPDSHPLELREAGNRPAWACPVNGRSVAPVGELGGPSGHPGRIAAS